MYISTYLYTYLTYIHTYILNISPRQKSVNKKKSLQPTYISFDVHIYISTYISNIHTYILNISPRQKSNNKKQSLHPYIHTGDPAYTPAYLYTYP
jgi:hypothetical protein